MKKILLVEDNDELLNKKLQEIKSSLVYPVRVVRNFSDLQTYVISNKEDIFIVLLDYYLDGAMKGEGLDLLMKYSIPTIVYTSEFSNEIRENVFNKGALEYLIKKQNSDFHYTNRLIQRVCKNDFIKALIVDGSKDFRENLEKKLQQFGLKSLHAYDAPSTLKQLHDHNDIQLVIIDLDIQGDIQGIDLVEDIREEFPSTKLAILGISPHGYNSQISIEFLKKGANDFIIKPFVKEQLNLRIMQLLELLDTIEEKNIESIIDPLTKLKNRRALDREAPKMIQSSKNKDKSLAVAMIDIDHFKQVNDTYGHDVGDGVLKFISNALVNSFRQNDLLVRNGGEEFCVILEGLNIKDSEEIFDKFRQKIESSSYRDENININITISIGLFYGLEKDIETMLSIADENLYKAKHAGRNKVISSSNIS